MRIEKIFDDGVLIDLDVGCWSGHSTLRPEDLGLRKDQVPDIFKLGRKRLVAIGALAPIKQVERQAREFLRGWGFRFPIAGARFVPKGSLGTVVERMDTLEKDFHHEVQVFLEHYDGHKEQMLQKYAAYRQALEAYYPTPDALERTFSFNYVIYATAVPEEAGLSAERRNALQERMAAFTDEVVSELRKQTQVLFQKVAAKLARGEIVKQGTFEKIRLFTQRFELLNFLDDREILDRLRRLRIMVDNLGGAALDVTTAPDLRTGIQTAVDDLVKAAGDLSDIDKVTGDYKRRILVEA